MKTRTCTVCGFSFDAEAVRGRGPTKCDDCTGVRRGSRTADPASTDAFLKLLHHCELRLAVEIAASALRMGRPKDALHALEAVPARASVRGARVYNGSAA